MDPLQSLGPPPQPMMSSAPAPQMQAQGAGGMPGQPGMGQPGQQPQINPQMLAMIRQHVMRQALIQNAIQKAKMAGVRDAQRKMAMTKAQDKEGDNPNDIWGEASPNDPQFGVSTETASGNSGYYNSPGGK